MKAVRLLYLVFSYDFERKKEGWGWKRQGLNGEDEGGGGGKEDEKEEKEEKKHFSQVYIPKHRLKLLNVW